MSNFLINYKSDNVCYVYFLKRYVETMWIFTFYISITALFRK